MADDEELREDVFGDGEPTLTLHPGPDDAPHTGWVWAAMEPAERRARMRELAEWVEWLVEAHALHNTVPPCWYLHTAVREHLTALYAGWIRVYCAENDQAGRDLGEAEWITALHNFAPYLQAPACLSGGHQEPPVRRRNRTEAADELAAYLWTSDFGTQPARHPAPEAVLRQHPVDEQL